jgi:hypothetical protein
VSPRIDPHDAFTVAWGARRLVKLAVTLVMGAVFLALHFGTDLPALLGGPSLGPFVLAGACFAVGAALYFPLAAAAEARLLRKLAASRRPPPT